MPNDLLELIMVGRIDEPAFYRALPAFVGLDREERRGLVRKIRVIWILRCDQQVPAWGWFWQVGIRALQVLATFENESLARIAARHLIEDYFKWQQNN